MKKVLALLLITCIVLSCNSGKKKLEKNDNGGDVTYNVEGDDKEMNRAIEEARRTYPDFLKVFQSGDTSNYAYTVKMRFGFGENSGEHMWLGKLYFKNDQLFGVLDSDPVNVKSVKYGDSLRIVTDSLSDWMYLKNNKLVGGYTIRVLYNKMTEPEKAEFRKEMGFEIE